MKPLLAALRFLTVFPLPGAAGTAEDDLARSVPWFTAVGLLLGALAAALAWGLSLAAPPLVVAALLVVAMIVFSGGLHCDGLADTADGFYSARTRERMLEIMQDSRIGAMGVLALVCVLLVKFASLASLAAEAALVARAGVVYVASVASVASDASSASLGSDALWRVALLTPLAGRASLAIQLALLPYARESGLATVFYRRPRWPGALAAVAVLLAVGVLVLGLRGVVIAAASLAAAVLASGYVYYKIRGATGDTLGAVCELTEVVPALVYVVLFVPVDATR